LGESTLRIPNTPNFTRGHLREHKTDGKVYEPCPCELCLPRELNFSRGRDLRLTCTVVHQRLWWALPRPLEIALGNSQTTGPTRLIV
jgi:hypothetical protein